MAEYSMPWAGEVTGDVEAGGYPAGLWDDIFQAIVAGDQAATQGVLLGVDNGLAVTGAGSPVAVASGKAFVNGKYYENSASKNINVASPAAATRTDYIVLQADYTAQTVRAVLLLNDAEGTGVPPALTQVDGTTWEIPLAILTVAMGGGITVTDARAYCQFASQVITAMLQDGILTADAAGRAKMANGFIMHEQMANNAIPATAPGRLVIADGYVNLLKLAAGIDASAIGFRAAEVSYKLIYFDNPTDTYIWNNQAVTAAATITSGDMRGAGAYGDIQIPATALGVILGGRITGAVAHAGVYFCPTGRDPDYFDQTVGQIQVAGQYVEFNNVVVKFGTGGNVGKINVRAFLQTCQLWANAIGYISKV